MEDIYRFRYKIYCEEKKFLPVEDYPSGLEIDEYDEASTHFVVYGQDMLPAGYMRSVDGDLIGFPLFDHGLTTYTDIPYPLTGGAVETSRMMVRDDYRRRAGSPDDSFPAHPSLPNPPCRNASTLIQLKLLRLAYRHALENDTRWFYAAMESPLSRLLGKVGFPFRQIGPRGEYFGEVIPYAMDLREMEFVMRTGFPGTWTFFDNPADDLHCATIRGDEWSIPTRNNANQERQYGHAI